MMKRIDTFENANGIVEIRQEGDGVFRLKPTTFHVEPGRKVSSDFEQRQLAQALAWWRGKTKARILAVTGFNGDSSCSGSLIVVTDIEIDAYRRSH